MGLSSGYLVVSPPRWAARPAGTGTANVTVFLGSRFSRSADGFVTSAASNVAAERWARGLDGVAGVRLAARVCDAACSEDHRVVGTVVPLPYYVGLRQLVAALPRLAFAVDRAVASSSVVVLRMPDAIGYLATASCVLRGRPFAIDLAGDVEEVFRSGVAGAFGRRTAALNRAVVARIVRRANAVRYVTATALQAKYPAGGRATTVAFSAVDLPRDWFGAPTAPKSPEPTIVAVGTHEQLYKGHDDLIRALPRILAEHPTTTLRLVGNGRYQAHLRELAAELGVAEHVRFEGYLPDRADLKALLDSAWVFAQPSVTEGLPRALIEAMARRLPCVGSDVGGIPELLPPEAMVPPRDPVALAGRLCGLLASAALRDRLAERNLEEAGRFHPDRIAGPRQAWREAIADLRDRRAVALPAA